MRVALFANTHVPLDCCPGGMEYSTIELARALGEVLSPDDRVDLVCHPATQIDVRGVRVVGVRQAECAPEYERHGEGRRKWIQYAAEAPVMRLASLFNEVDLIHNSSHSIMPSLLGWLLRRPVVDTCRLMPWHPCYVQTADFVDQRVYLSRFQACRDRWMDKGRKRIIRDAVPVEELSVEKFDAGSSYAISVGRVEPAKGHLHAVRVAAKLGFRLVVVGPIISEEYARDLTLLGATVRGPCARKSILGLIRDAAVLVWTPQSPEPGGRVVAEALRLGTLVVGTAVGLLADLAEHGEASRIHLEGEERALVRACGVPSFMPATPLAVAEEYVRMYKEVTIGFAARRDSPSASTV